MDQTHGISPELLKSRLERIATELRACYPKAVLLFGSAVAFLDDPRTTPRPHDLDILLVADNPLLDADMKNITPPVELHRFRSGEVIAVARSLRYNSKAVALSKLYAKNLAKQHARDVILAAILLGPNYNDFGIEQIDVGGRPDSRDYSRHLILSGHGWWQRLTAWALERRNLLQRLADKMIMADRFA